MMNSKIKILTLILLLPSFLFAQEVLKPIGFNKELINLKTDTQLKNVVEEEALTLPFVDDFSYRGVYPTDSKWSDRFAFVNNNFAILAPTKGVATFDALDEHGWVYDHANPYGFSADTLTSLEIRLDSLFNESERALTISDSLYLSFYYQPQGYGNAPEAADSLILEFLSVNENDTIFIEADPDAVPPVEADTIVNEAWRSVWNADGKEFEQFFEEVGDNFLQVMIPITDSARYYTDSFRFRFRNMASVEGNNLESYKSNVDQWHVDYVKLDVDRTYDDTTHRDITFVGPAPSFLENYSAMPYWQYAASIISSMVESVDLKISNISDNNILGHYKYEVFSEGGSSLFTYNGGDATLAPYSVQAYSEHFAFANPPVLDPLSSTSFMFPTYGEKQEFEIVHTIWSDITLPQSSNDTLIYKQMMDNYYAYDDGSSENGYGFSTAYGEFATLFGVSSRDTLRGVQILFNHIFNESENERPFRINVYEYSNNKPGDLIYSQDFSTPITYDDNMFHIYTFADPVKINASTQFFVGVQQLSDEFLNIGFDRNSDMNEFTRINTGNGWSTSSYDGVPMIRPVMGAAVSSGPYGEDELTIDNLNIYPNPVSGTYFSVDIDESDFNNKNYEIYNVNGVLVLRGQLTKRVDCAGLTNGMYIVRITDEESAKQVVKKIVINRF